MDEQKIKREQADFYSQGNAGCKFAEHVAKDPEGYNWIQRVYEKVDVPEIDSFIDASIADPKISMVSLIFPSVTTPEQLEDFVNTVTANSRFLFQEPEGDHAGFRLIHLRAKVLGKSAWISGFAPIDFLPKTRQAPYTEIVFRVKERPNYPKSIMPEPPTDTLHVADLEVPYMDKVQFTRAFQQSFANTARILGHHADELSAAKVTFIFPKKP